MSSIPQTVLLERRVRPAARHESGELLIPTDIDGHLWVLADVADLDLVNPLTRFALAVETFRDGAWRFAAGITYEGHVWKRALQAPGFKVNAKYYRGQRIRVVCTMALALIVGATVEVKGRSPDPQPPDTHRSIAFVQSAKLVGAGEVANLALAYTSNVTAGSLLVTCMNTEDKDSHSCVNSLSHTYVLGPATTNGVAVRASMFYVGNIGSGGACTVTIDFTGSDFCSMSILEKSGTFDSTPLHGTAATATGTSSTPSVGMTTTATASMVAHCALAYTGLAPTVTADADYVERQKAEGAEEENGPNFQTQDRLEKASGADTANWTWSQSMAWVALIAAFEESGGAAAPVRLRRMPLLGMT